MALVGHFDSGSVYLYTIRRTIRSKMCREHKKNHTFTKYGNKIDFYNISINMHHRPGRHICLHVCTFMYKQMYTYAYHTIFESGPEIIT